MWKLSLIYKRVNPKLSGVGIGIGPFLLMNFVRVNKIEKMVIHCKTEQDCITLLKEIREGKCLKCGHINNNSEQCWDAMYDQI